MQKAELSIQPVDDFYHLDVIFPAPAFQQNYFHIGYIPSNITEIDTGSPNYTSLVLRDLVTELWNRELLFNNIDTLECCTVNINHERSWWLTAAGRRDIRKFVQVINSIKNYLNSV